MKTKRYIFLLILTGAMSCADNNLDVLPDEGAFPFQLVLDTDEGGDLADAEDFGLEVKFADYLGDLPQDDIIISYALEGEDAFEGVVAIDKVVYVYEDEGGCEWERSLAFNAVDGTITLTKDADTGELPTEFEVVFALPGEDDTEGTFTFELTGVQSDANVAIGGISTFEYEVLDNEVAGEWVLELTNEEDFERFKSVFSVVSSELSNTAFDDITGKVTIEFEYKEMKIEVELKEEEESCEDGELETGNKTIEIEAEYDAEDGELVLEGSYLILGDDGEPEDELDFVLSAEYSLDELSGTILIKTLNIVDEDHFEEGDELFAGEEDFVFERD
ncbi:MAG: hypothetical protein HC859_03940 [Bacteroidia bacterium]|nr:hypothetical protein [Bacteroidia bacterium]